MIRDLTIFSKGTTADDTVLKVFYDAIFTWVSTPVTIVVLCNCKLRCSSDFTLVIYLAVNHSSGNHAAIPKLAFECTTCDGAAVTDNPSDPLRFGTIWPNIHACMRESMTECTAFDSSCIRNFAIYFSVHKCGTRLNGKLDFILQCTTSQLELSLFQGQRFDPEQVCSIRPKFCIHVICRWCFTKRNARTNLDLNDIIRHPGIVFLFQYLYSALCPGHPFCKCLNRHHAHYHADCQHCTDQAFSYPFSHCTSFPFVFLYSHLNIMLIALSSLWGSFL